MARCNRWLLLASVFGLLALGTVNSARSAAETARSSFTMELAQRSVDRAASSVRAAQCKTRRCETVLRISEALEIQRAAELTMMGAARWRPWNAPQIAEQRWKKLLRIGPSDARELCRLSQDMASQYQGNADDGSSFITQTLVILSFRIDRSRGSHICLPAIVGSLRPIAASNRVLKGVQTICIYGWKLGAACDVISRK